MAKNLPIKTELLCSTTGWQNNCGLNCVVHYFDYLLKTNQLEQFTLNPEYAALLDTFQAYYQLSEKPKWQDIKRLLDNYSNPTDKEAILAPVLRQHLGKKLNQMAQETWDLDAAAAISEFLVEGKVQDIALPLYHANKTWLERLKTKYDRSQRRITSQIITENERLQAMTQLGEKKPPIEFPTEKQIKAQVEFNRKNAIQDNILAEAKNYWLSDGNRLYAERMGDLSKAEMVSADQLSVLCESLSIGLEVYTPASLERARLNPNVAKLTHGAQNLPKKEYPLSLKVHNRGVHWEYEEPSQNAAAVASHNQFYEERNGEFNTLEEEGETLNHLIRASVVSTLNTSPKPAVTTPPKRTPSPENLEIVANSAMDKLINYLDNQHRTGALSDNEQKELFEYYFTAFENELSKGKNASKKNVEAVAEEIKHHNLKRMREHLTPLPKSKKPKP